MKCFLGFLLALLAPVLCDPLGYNLDGSISKCCDEGEYLQSSEDFSKECVKQPLEIYKDLRRYHPYLRDFNLTAFNPCDSVNGSIFEIRSEDIIRVNDLGSLLLSTAHAHRQFHDHWCLDIFGPQRSLVVLACENRPFISKRFAVNQNAKTLAMIVLLVLFVTSIALIVVGKFFNTIPMTPLINR